jgi:hypothetical protein
MKHLDQEHVLPGIYPVADFMAGTVATDIFEVMSAEGAAFDIIKGVGTTGTSTITVLACDDTSPSNTSAVTFFYRISTTPDVWGDWTAATTAGFVTTAGSNQMYQVWVDAAVLAEVGYGYVKLVATESVNDPVIGAILGRVVGLRYGPQPTSLID